MARVAGLGARAVQDRHTVRSGVTVVKSNFLGHNQPREGGFGWILAGFAARAQRGEGGGAWIRGGSVSHVRTVGSRAAASAGVQVASLLLWHTLAHHGSVQCYGTLELTMAASRKLDFTTVTPQRNRWYT